MEIYREITSLTPNDCFVAFAEDKTRFDFPLHVQGEYELVMLRGVSCAHRVVGSSREETLAAELLLTAPGVAHGWFSDRTCEKSFRMVTIRFASDFLEAGMLARRQFAPIRKLLQDAAGGVLFPEAVTYRVASRVEKIASCGDFVSVLDLLALLNELALTPDRRILSQRARRPVAAERIVRVYDHMMRNYYRQVTLGEVAQLAGMSEVSFSRFIKKQTGVNFIEALNDIRLGYVVRLLNESGLTVHEVASRCGFNNMANFNRIFKRRFGITPSAYRRSPAVDWLYV